MTTNILKDLDIKIIGEENTIKCHSNPVVFQNEGLKVRNLRDIQGALPRSKTMRFHLGFWFITFHQYKVRITPNSSKMEGYSS